MIYSIQNLELARFIVIFYIILISACTNNKNYNRQINNGNDKYLYTSELKTLVAPSGITLPAQNSDFKIPITNNHSNKDLGKNLDIRPPS